MSNITKVEVLKTNGNVHTTENFINNIKNGISVEIKLPIGVYRLRLTTVSSYSNPWDRGIIYKKNQILRLQKIKLR